MPEENECEFVRYSVSLVTQGRHRFYTLTMDSNILAATCFVSTREEDPDEGFQRLLDEKRAEDIANYIDHGHGTIPNSIVLSAQQSSEFKVIGRGKTIEFKPIRRAFLIIDGQHRVFGFKKANTKLRVPVVIYSGLNRRDESRLFIDINTKQRPVPNELLLDIKKLAEYETESERLMSAVFDMFQENPSSPLLGHMSPHERRQGKISRVTFNAAIKPLLPSFEDAIAPEIFNALRGYLEAFIRGCTIKGHKDAILNPTVFRACMLLFPHVAQRVQDRYDRDYSIANFDIVLEPFFARLQRATLSNPGRSYKDLYNKMAEDFRQQFTL